MKNRWNYGRIDESGRTDDAVSVETGRGNGAGSDGLDGGKETAFTDYGFYGHPSAGRERIGRT